ncbi:MAG: sn-glycerol-1-phosphate dehydrogenase [bacterium]
MTTMPISLTSVLAPYMGRLRPGAVVIAPDAMAHAAGTLQRVLPKGVWLIVADPITQAMAARDLVNRIAGSGMACRSLVLSSERAGDELVADSQNVNRLIAEIRSATPGIVAVVAVGSGTVNDIVKLATFKAGIPFAVVATAPSMNGYTSPIAAILCDGVKTVQPAHTAQAVIADVGILSSAPARMIAAGFGDLISKPVSHADWLLSHLLTGSKYCSDAVKLVEEGNRYVMGTAEGLRAREPEAVGRLMAALLLSGFAMSLAGTSAPASGGEHLISHYLDMTHYADGAPHDLHGCQVGVATVVAASLYERLLTWDPAELDIGQRVDALEPWPLYEAGLQAKFGTLAGAVMPHAREGYPDAGLLETRLTRVKREWPGLTERLRSGLRPHGRILADLRKAGCPSSFKEIGCTPGRARDAVLLSKDIRPRYTILHLCWELGVLESWADEILCRLA